MSRTTGDILSADEVRELTAKKHDLQRQLLGATKQGTADRLTKQIIDIAEELDTDAMERREYDEARQRAANIAANVATSVYGPGNASSGPTHDEVRTFVTPGSPVRDLWLRPAAEEHICRAAELGRRGDTVPYLTTPNSTGADHFFVPELYNQVAMGMLAASGILEANPTVITTNHLRPILVPYLSSDATATAGTEGSPATAAHTAGNGITLGAFRYDGLFSVSIETLMASEFNVENLLTTFAIRATANKVAAMLALGNGTTEPQGLFDTAAVVMGVTTASTTLATADEVLALTKSVSKGYRKQSVLVTSDVLHTQLLQLKDGQGDYLLRSIEGGGQQFAGKPLYVEPQADQSGMSATEVHAICGDFAGYFVRLSPMLFRRSDADPLNPQFSFAVWCDAKVVDANSLRALLMHA